MKSQHMADAGYLTFALVLVALAAAGSVALWPNVVAAAHGQAGELVASARTATDPREVRINYQLALALDPGNQAARLGLAQAQISTGQAEAALVTLEGAGGESAAARLRIRTLTELGRAGSATGAASDLAKATGAEADAVLAGLVYAAAGQPGDIAPLMPLVASPEAVQSLARAEAGNLALATELYAHGLPNSAQRIALKQPVSFERNMLLARLAYDRHTAADLDAAAGYLKVAVIINPADAAAHQFLATIYTEQNLPIESQKQTDLATKILSGRP